MGKASRRSSHGRLTSTSALLRSRMPRIVLSALATSPATLLVSSRNMHSYTLAGISLPVVLIHALVDSLANPEHDAFNRFLDRVLDRWLFRGTELAEHVFDRLPLFARHVDADPQPRILGRAEVSLDVAQAVVPAMGAASTEPQLAQRQVHVIAD